MFFLLRFKTHCHLDLLFHLFRFTGLFGLPELPFLELDPSEDFLVLLLLLKVFLLEVFGMLLPILLVVLLLLL